MNEDTIIDFNHLFNIILESLIQEFPKSKSPFKLQEVIDSSGLDKLESDDSYYFFKLFKYDLTEFIRRLLKKNGIIEDCQDGKSDSVLTEPGLRIVEAGSFQKYQTNKERQEKLQFEILETTAIVNRSTIETNVLQKMSLRLSMATTIVALTVSVFSLYISYVSQNSAKSVLKLTEKSLELQRQDIIFRKSQDSLSHLNRKDTLRAGNYHN